MEGPVDVLHATLDMLQYPNAGLGAVSCWD